MKRPWLLPLVLGFSLGCNALLGGFVVTQQLRSWLAPVSIGPSEFGEHRTGRLLRDIIARLPPSDAEIMREVLRGHLLEIAAAQRKVMLALEQARTALAAPTLDRPAFEQSVAATAEARQALGRLLQSLVVPALERMSPEGRRVIAGFRLAG